MCAESTNREQTVAANARDILARQTVNGSLFPPPDPIRSPLRWADPEPTSRPTKGDTLTSSTPAGTPQPLPEQRLHDLLPEPAPLKLAAAESCTGGGVAARIVSIAGSSVYFQGSVVSYSNEAKATILGVPRDILENPGAVSDESARAMAEGARRVFDADIAVSTTGIAGPTGGTTRKPVGLVYIAASSPTGIVVNEHHFPGNRAAVIAAATDAALDLLVETVAATISAVGR